MQVVSNCPKCGCSYGWTMNQVESTPDGGTRPARSPNCPRCGYDVTGTNDRAPRGFHYYAEIDDVEGIRNLLQRRETITRERERLVKEWERLMREWHEARARTPRRLTNLFGLLAPPAPAYPVLPDVPPPADINARVPDNCFNPLVVAAINGSRNATEFLLNHGVDRAAIPLALEKAKQFGHPEIMRLLAAQV